MSVTQAHLNHVSFQWSCNLVTHYSDIIVSWSDLVQLTLRKMHLFSGVEGSIQSVTEAKGEGLGACPLRTPTIFDRRCMMMKQSFDPPDNSVL